jgi:hypothetical protein
LSKFVIGCGLAPVQVVVIVASLSWHIEARAWECQSASAAARSSLRGSLPEKGFSPTISGLVVLAKPFG